MNMEAYYLPQSGVLPCRRREDGNNALELLLVTTSNGAFWTVPKGHVEPELSAKNSAIKEAWEEAGVCGEIISNRECGTYTYSKCGACYHVKLFPMRVDRVADDWPESCKRKRQWMTPSQAAAAVPFSELAAILKHGEKILNEHSSE